MAEKTGYEQVNVKVTEEAASSFRTAAKENGMSNADFFELLVAQFGEIGGDKASAEAFAGQIVQLTKLYNGALATAASAQVTAEARVQSQLDALSKNLLQKDEIIEGQKATVKAAKEAAAAAQEAQTAAEQELQAVADRLNQETQGRQDLQQEAEELRSRAEQLQGALQTMTEARETAAAEILDLKASVADLKQQLALREQDKAGWMAERAQLTADAQRTLDQARSEWMTERIKLTADAKGATDRADLLEQARAQAEHDRDAARAELEELRSQLGQLEDLRFERITLQEAVKRAEERATDREQQLQDAKERERRLEARLERLESK